MCSAGPQPSTLIKPWVKARSLSARWNTAFALADQAMVSAANFAATVLLGRYCTKSELGLYMLGLVTVFFAVDVQSMVLSTPYAIYRPRYSGRDLAEFTGSSVVHALAFSAIVASGLYLARPVLASLGPRGFRDVLAALVCAAAGILFKEHVRRVCFARFSIGKAIALDLLAAGVQVSALGLLVLDASLNARSAFLVLGFAGALSASAVLLWTRIDIAARPSRIVGDFMQNWSVGQWVMASGLAWASTTSVYPWLLSVFHGSAAVGMWGACLSIAAVVNPVLTGAQNLIAPQLAVVYSRGGVRELRLSVSKAALQSTLLVGPLCALLFIFGGDAVRLTYGASYAGGGTVVALLSVNALVSASAFCFSRGLFAAERADRDFYANIVSIVILIVVGVWMTKSFGAPGVAAAMLCGNVGSALARYWLLACLR